MRVIFGILIGIALTIGAAAFHDNNVPAGLPSLNPAERRIVDWDALSAVADGWFDWATGLWGDASEP